MYEQSNLKKIGIQFFAEGGEGGEPGAGGAGGNPDNGGSGGSGGTGGEGGGTQAKTFTQEEVNRMLANEKRQGRQSVLKALGLDPNDKYAEKKAKAILDGQKTKEEKDAEALKAEQEARSNAEAKAAAAEHKLTALTNGCKKDYIDEVIALASAKVDETTDFETALKAVKEKCPAFFDEGDPGTGGGQGHRRNPKDEKPGSFGARLAQSVVSANTKKNPYFND